MKKNEPIDIDFKPCPKSFSEGYDSGYNAALEYVLNTSGNDIEMTIPKLRVLRYSRKFHGEK